MESERKNLESNLQTILPMSSKDKRNLEVELKSLQNINSDRLKDSVIKSKENAVKGKNISRCDSHSKFSAIFRGYKRRFSLLGERDKHSRTFKKRRKSEALPAKRRKSEMIIPPNRFLLGGNINDPLNLNSLADEEINRRLNEVTPKSSPIPTPKHRQQVEVIIPPNINDPLNLNSGEDIDLNLISPKIGKRKKHRKHKKHDGKNNNKGENMDTENEKVDNKTQIEEPEEVLHKKDQEKIALKNEKRIDDKIVSPVIPQISRPKKRWRSGNKSMSRSISNEEGKKSKRCQPDSKTVKFRKKNELFQYGNYNRYYGYRNPNHEEDYRLKCLRREWFENKDILDIGCNVGYLTLSIARDFGPNKVIGLDIDGKLIAAARRNIRHYLSTDIIQKNRFPLSMALCFGPVAVPTLPGKEEENRFPNNIFFIEGNYVLESDSLLESQKQEYDTILCLSTTKWVHLNWCDDGLKRTFKRIYRQLRSGGHLILEAQGWKSYSSKKKLTETIFKNYESIRFHPEQFTEYLLSKEVGFSKCEVIDVPFNKSKGFRRPLQLFTKLATASNSQSQTPVPIRTPEPNHHFFDE